MWLEVARNGRNRGSKKRTHDFRLRRAAAFHRAGERGRQGEIKASGEGGGVPGGVWSDQGIHYHGGFPSGSNIPANGVETQRKSCAERGGKLGRGGEIDAAGEALRGGRGDRQVGTGAIACAAAGGDGAGKTGGCGGCAQWTGQRGEQEDSRRAVTGGARQPGGGFEDARKDGVQLASMAAYAALSGDVGRKPGLFKYPAGGNLLRRHGGLRRAFGGDRAAADERAAAGLRPGWRESGDGAREHAGLRAAHSFSSSTVFGTGRGIRSGRDREAGRADGGSWGITASVNGGGTGVFVAGGRSAGHEDVEGSTADRRGHREFGIRTGARPAHLHAGRRKEEPEDSQSNRTGPAHYNHRSVGQADRGGCAPCG